MLNQNVSVSFQRDIYCILGLPFDAVSMTDALKHVRRASDERLPCFMSTPNLNFLIASHSDDDFRDSVVNSDLSIADGAPIVWIARLLKLPITERVSGSGLFEFLRASVQSPLKVFFFGGADGVAQRASQRLNDEKQGLIAVGCETPGFGSVEEMSRAETLANINASHADFLVIALGAKKGQAWIERNRQQLNVPVISHLGAVINFVAGHVRRAPVWVQDIGCEWLWRIYQEPWLWRRYYHDGLQLCRLLISKVLPYAIWIRLNRELLSDIDGLKIDRYENFGKISLVLTGLCTAKTVLPLRCALAELPVYQLLEIDLENVKVIDSAFIALCMLVASDAARRGGHFVLRNVSQLNRKIFEWNCAEYLLV